MCAVRGYRKDDISESMVKPTIHHENQGKTRARLYSRQEGDTVTNTNTSKNVSYYDMCSCVSVNAGHKANEGGLARREARAGTARNGGADSIE